MAKATAKTKGSKLPVRLENELAQTTPDAAELFTSVKHLPNLGDQIAVMPAVRKYWEVTGRKIKFMQCINAAGNYYPGAVHPTTTEDGTQVTMNQAMFDMMKPLIEAQPYIHSYVPYSGQPIDLDFDVIRGKTFVNLPHGAIQAWIVYAFPDLAFDLSKSWIELDGDCPEYVKEQVKGKVILNFTERYRNGNIDYFFLKNYSTDLIFAGTEREHWRFCNQWQLAIPRLNINNFLDLGYALREARFLLSNQSMCWNLAESIKSPRILELCQFAQNCQPMVGKDSYGFFHQVGVEYYFRLLYNQTLR